MTDDFARLKEFLKKLPADIQQQVVKGATRSAANVIAKDARARVPVDTGLLKKSIAVRRAKKNNQKEGHEIYYVVPLTKVKFTAKAKINGQNAKLKATRYNFHAHLVEFGTSKMKAQPFLRPAYEASAESSVEAFKKYANERVEKEAKKLAAKVGLKK